MLPHKWLKRTLVNSCRLVQVLYPFKIMEIRTEIKNGEIKLEIISILEDLRKDFEFFISRANQENSIIKHKRYLRAAYFTFNAYVEASVNRLYRIHMKRTTSTPSGKKPKKRQNFYEKSKILEKTYLADKLLSGSEKKALRTVRNRLAHFEEGDLRLWDKITEDDLIDHVKKHTIWLNALKKSIGVVEPDSATEELIIRALLGKMGIKTSEIL